MANNKPQNPAPAVPGAISPETATGTPSGNTKLSGIVKSGDSTEAELDAANRAAGHPGNGAADEPAAEAKKAPEPANKMAPQHANKMAAAPANKAEPAANQTTASHMQEVEALDSFYHGKRYVKGDKFKASKVVAEQLAEKKLVKISNKD